LAPTEFLNQVFDYLSGLKAATEYPAVIVWRMHLATLVGFAVTLSMVHALGILDSTAKRNFDKAD